MRIVDGFLDDFESFRSHCDGLDYTGVVNPADGVMYPGISMDIPDDIKSEIISKLEDITGAPIVCNTMFLRLSVSGGKDPHQAHNDTVMGDKAAFLYLNRTDHTSGGTSLLKHIGTGMDSDPATPEQFDAWERDTNNYNAWNVVQLFKMVPNRMVTFDSKLMHRSEPPGGFGTDAIDGRLVLISFYGLKND